MLFFTVEVYEARGDVTFVYCGPCILFTYGFSYVLGAVETFLKAVPSAGIFRGNGNVFEKSQECCFSLVVHESLL